MKFQYKDKVKIKHPFYKNLYGCIEHYKKTLFGKIKYQIFIYRDKENNNYLCAFEWFSETDLEKVE